MTRVPLRPRCRSHATMSSKRSSQKPLVRGRGIERLAGEELRVDADGDDLLVVRAVEDADLAAGGQRELAPPQPVVRQLHLARLLERGHPHALRVQAAHDVLDRAVLARGVHRLEDHEQRPAPLGVQPLLQHVERGEVLGAARLRALLVQIRGVVGVVIAQLEALGADAEPLLEIHARTIRGSGERSAAEDHPRRESRAQDEAEGDRKAAAGDPHAGAAPRPRAVGGERDPTCRSRSAVGAAARVRAVAWCGLDYPRTRRASAPAFTA